MKTEEIFEKISSLHMPSLILLAARPGMGKTSFALNMARIVAEQKTVAVFSLEMSREQMADRLLACAPLAENERIHTGTIYIGFLCQIYMPSAASWTIWARSSSTIYS